MGLSSLAWTALDVGGPCVEAFGWISVSIQLIRGLNKSSKNAFFPPVGFSPSWKCDQLLRVSTNMPAHRSFSVGGSIARRRSPGRNCSRARRAAAHPIVVANWISSRRGTEFAEERGIMIAFSAPAAALREPPSLPCPKILKNPSNCCYLRPFATDCRPSQIAPVPPTCPEKALAAEQASPARSRPPCFVPFVLSRPFHNYWHFDQADLKKRIDNRIARLLLSPGRCLPMLPSIKLLCSSPKPNPPPSPLGQPLRDSLYSQFFQLYSQRFTDVVLTHNSLPQSRMHLKQGQFH